MVPKLRHGREHLRNDVVYVKCEKHRLKRKLSHKYGDKGIRVRDYSYNSNTLRRSYIKNNDKFKG